MACSLLCCLCLPPCVFVRDQLGHECIGGTDELLCIGKGAGLAWRLWVAEAVSQGCQRR